MCILLTSPYACNHLPLNHILFCPAGITVSNICDDYIYSHRPPLPKSKWLCIECAPVKAFEGVADEEHFLSCGVGNNGEVMKALNRADGSRMNAMEEEAYGPGDESEAGRGSWRARLFGKPRQRKPAGCTLKTPPPQPSLPPRVMKHTQDGYLVFDLFQEVRNEERREERRRVKEERRVRLDQIKSVGDRTVDVDSVIAYSPKAGMTAKSISKAAIFSKTPVQRSIFSTIQRIPGLKSGFI